MLKKREHEVGVYRLLPDTHKWPSSWVDGCHAWTLPGVRCPLCGSWGEVALEYPALKTPHLKRSSGHARWPVPLDDFKEMESALAKLLPSSTKLGPGAEFGPFTGKVVGRVADFMWKSDWTLFVRREAFAALEQKGVRLPVAVSPNLKGRSNGIADLVELQIEPLAIWNVSSLKRPLTCGLCGFFRDGLTGSRTPPILLSSIPNHVDLFRIEQATGTVVCTGRFAKAAKALGLSNVSFKPMAQSESNGMPVLPAMSKANHAPKRRSLSANSVGC
ncbi:MAG: hypothetical protein HZA92_20025 [Verrucomicrobia bacterium]|nr:hypothetical protein [Verrucomicrobiota bacterium]